MRHKILSLVVALALAWCGGARAQSDARIYAAMDSMAMRLEAMERELFHLRLCHEVSNLTGEIMIKQNEVSARADNLTVAYHLEGKFLELVKAYGDYYGTCLEDAKALRQKAELVGKVVGTKLRTYPFTKAEREVLEREVKVLETSYNALVSSIELLRIAIATYKP
ncbi:MAG: hypothetical protein HUK04_03465 [Bacteroidaceae bacterium]|nr:hypothetical protein [Bacteroidaceae bacterium]